MLHNAKDRSPDQKAVIETLLGHRVLENEAVSVRAIEPPALSHERRQGLAREPKPMFENHV